MWCTWNGFVALFLRFRIGTADDEINTHMRRLPQLCLKNVAPPNHLILSLMNLESPLRPETFCKHKKAEFPLALHLQTDYFAENTHVKPPLLTLLLSFFPTNSPLALSLLYFFTTPVRAMVKTKRDTTKVHTSKGHQWPVMSGETLASLFYHDTQQKMRWIRLQKWTND